MTSLGLNLTLVLFLFSSFVLFAQTKELWENGNLKSEGQFASNGLKTGLWKYYYPNGQLEAQGQYLAKKQESTNEIVKASRESALASYVLRHQGELSTREGEWQFWFEDGKPKGKGSYKNGCPQGSVIRWHSNGSKAEEAEYQNCKPSGNRKMWDRDGQLYFENQIQGEGRSLEIEWYANGQKKSEVPYKNGMQFGRVRRWYPNGEREEEVMMRNTRVHGQYRSWHENGNRQREFFSINNIMSGEYKEWNKIGQLLKEVIELPSEKMIQVREFWPNGQLKVEGRSKLHSSLSIHQWTQTREGEWTYWNPEGKIIKTERYAEGRLTATIMP